MYDLLITYIKPLDSKDEFKLERETKFNISMDDITSYLSNLDYQPYRISIKLSKLPF